MSDQPQTDAPLPPELRWRVPTGGDPRLLRLALAQIGMGAIVCALVLLVAAPREWLVPALVGIVPLAVFLAYRRWRQFEQAQQGPDNVRLDQAGLHWLDRQGQERTFERGSVAGYHIGHDPDTLRPVPSLVLHLAGGLQTQPIELHPPARPMVVRRWLAEKWQVAERPKDESAAEQDYDAALDVYSECHAEFQEWHWEGTRESLAALLAQFAAAAELPLAPLGARPARRVILAQRRDASRVRLEHDRYSRLDEATIAGSAELHRDLSRLGQEALAGLESSATRADVSFDVPLSSTSRWTFHFHVREM